MVCMAFQKIFLTSHTGKPSHLGSRSLLLGIAVPWGLKLLRFFYQHGLRRDPVCKLLLGKTVRN